MGILLAFAPFIVFAVLDRIVGPAGALAAAAGVSAALIARDLVRSGRSTKILEVGTFVLFSGLGLYAVLSGASWSVIGVRLCVDAGLLGVVLASMAAGRPFTLQYAREVVDAETAKLPGFLRANYIITWAWAGAALLMMVGNGALIYVPGLPLWLGLAIAFAARNSAVYFTKWYPQYRKAKYGTAPVNALPSTH